MIVGSQKCGTTSIFRLLRGHYDVGASYIKEPQFFEAEYHKGLEYYRSMFMLGAVTLEARVFNLVIGYVPTRIYELLPHTKIIVMLRDPVRRAHSAWSAFRRMRAGRERYDFDTAMYEGWSDIQLNRFDWEGNYIPNRDPKGGTYENIHVESGFYMHHIRRYDTLFRGRIFVGTLERMKREPQAFFNELTDFMEISPISVSEAPLENAAPESIDVYDEYPETAGHLKSLYRHSVHELSVWRGYDFVQEWGYE